MTQPDYDRRRRFAAVRATLPKPETTVYGYIPVRVFAQTAYVAGQIPKVPGGLFAVGRVGAAIDLETARAAAVVAADQALAWLDAEAGGLENVACILRADCFVAAADDFAAISEVADAASGRLIEVFGEDGRHPRSVIGVARLPREAPVLLEVTAGLRSTL